MLKKIIFSKTTLCLLLLIGIICLDIVTYDKFHFALYDILFMTVILIGLLMFVLTPSTVGFDKELISKSDGIYKDAYIRKNAWLKSNMFGIIANYVIVAVSFLSTLIVIYITGTAGDAGEKKRIIFYSIISLFTSIMNYAITPLAMAKGYRLAYQEIDKAILEYENTGKSDPQILERALVKGEEYIKTYVYEMKS